MKVAIGNRMRILVVDDDPATVHGMTRLLVGDGHVVSAFTSGAEAAEALSQGKFDVVMTDLEMPGVDGQAIARTARVHSPEACVVVATARAVEKEQVLIDAGACIVSDKPVDYDSLTSAVLECRHGGGGSEPGGGRERCHMRSRSKPTSLAPSRRHPW
jgi:CheY-like chemotaxis protein